MNRPKVVLTALNLQGPMTADEFVSTRGWYVNSWAPTFTHLRKNGLIRRTGRTAVTSHGAQAQVVEITDKGRIWLTRN